MSFLSIDNLKVDYVTDDGIVHALNGVSLELVQGETLGLVGETGAGKTTMAKCIMGILPKRTGKIRSGEITFEEKNLLKCSEKELQSIRGAQIAMIFQDPMTSLNPVLTVGEQIAEAVENHERCGKARAMERAEEMLELVGIPAERVHEYPHQFSGGMKQRIVIAIALACRPKLILADEPTTALDVTIQAQVLTMMLDLQKQINTAMVIITHDLGIIAQTCQKVAVMYGGMIVEFGTVEHIFDSGNRHPYTQGLFDSIPKLDEETDRLIPIEGQIADPTVKRTCCPFKERCKFCTERCDTLPMMNEVEDGHFIRCHLFEGRENA